MREEIEGEREGERKREGGRGGRGGRERGGDIVKAARAIREMRDADPRNT
jgi:hypothetical protein